MIQSIAIHPTLTAPAAPAAPAALAAGDPVRPAVDWWDAAGTRYAATDELIRNFKPNADGTTQPATYHWRQETTPPPAARTLWPAVKGLAVGALAGIGGVIFAGVPAASWGPWMACFGVAGAVLFAVASVHQAKSEARAAAEHYENGTVVQGRLAADPQPDGQHVVFYVEGDVDSKVDLNEYATARPGPVDETNPPWWEQHGRW